PRACPVRSRSSRRSTASWCAPRLTRGGNARGETDANCPMDRETGGHFAKQPASASMHSIAARSKNSTALRSLNVISTKPRIEFLEKRASRGLRQRMLDLAAGRDDLRRVLNETLEFLARRYAASRSERSQRSQGLRRQNPTRDEHPDLPWGRHRY